MQTFCITTLGCKVNQYESEQIAAVLRRRGLSAVDHPADADLRIVNTCSVTVDAASQSRQSVRRATRLPVLATDGTDMENALATQQPTVVVGCWATSNRADATSIPGVAAVIGHNEDVAGRLDALLDQWLGEVKGCTDRSGLTDHKGIGTARLPLLHDRQSHRQRALLKIQDGCDARCTYCIIPRLRSRLWSKSVDDVVDEARRLVCSGHTEIVLTGIFLSAYGRTTAIRHRADESSPLADLIESLCTRVDGLHRLRLSSLEPGDVTQSLLATLRRHRQITPHFHLPLQSGSDTVLRRMNRQYRRDDYLRMIELVRNAFDRPAFTTDVIVGFPGETEAEFERTLEVVDRARFIQIHAFPFSPRPGTAAVRWARDSARGDVARRRVDRLVEKAAAASLEFREQFVGHVVGVTVEPGDGELRSGRCERFFPVCFPGGGLPAGQCVPVRIDRVTPKGTYGTLLERRVS